MRSAESFPPTASGYEPYAPPSLLSFPSFLSPRAFYPLAASARSCPVSALTPNQAPEIQTMYNVPLPVSALRTRVRQEFEKNRFVSKLPVVDVLLFKSHSEYQVRYHQSAGCCPGIPGEGKRGEEGGGAASAFAQPISRI